MKKATPSGPNNKESVTETIFMQISKLITVAIALRNAKAVIPRKEFNANTLILILNFTEKIKRVKK